MTEKDAAAYLGVPPEIMPRIVAYSPIPGGERRYYQDWLDDYKLQQPDRAGYEGVPPEMLAAHLGIAVASVVQRFRRGKIKAKRDKFYGLLFDFKDFVAQEQNGYAKEENKKHVEVDTRCVDLAGLKWYREEDGSDDIISPNTSERKRIFDAFGNGPLTMDGMKQVIGAVPGCISKERGPMKTYLNYLFCRREIKVRLRGGIFLYLRRNQYLPRSGGLFTTEHVSVLSGLSMSSVLKAIKRGRIKPVIWPHYAESMKKVVFDQKAMAPLFSDGRA